MAMAAQGARARDRRAGARARSPASGGRPRPSPRRYGLEFVDLTRFRIDNDLFRRIPFDLMLRYGFIPEAQLDGRLAVVMADPSDVVKIDELELLLGQPVEVKVGVRSAIEEILQKSESAQRVLDEASRGLPHPARAGGRGGRGDPVDRPHHRRHQPDHQAGRLDDLQRHPAPRLATSTSRRATTR